VGEEEQEEAAFSLADFFRIVAKLKWHLIVGAAAGFGIALLAGSLMTPIYRAEVTTMPTQEMQGMGSLGRLAGQFGGLAALAGISMPQNGNRGEALAVLKSKQFALDMIRDLNLAPVLFKSRWDVEKSVWRADLKRGAPSSEELWRRWDRGGVFSILDDRVHDLILVRIEWQDREVAAKWANELIARLNHTLRARRMGEIDKNMGFLKKELETAQVVELRTAIAEVMQAQVSERMLASVRQEYALKIIDPALPPDEDRPIRPRKALYCALGLTVGSILGFAFGLMLSYWRTRVAR
jgi:uncharacterized protein involved in exopolysaccharide biosynthesis